MIDSKSKSAVTNPGRAIFAFCLQEQMKTLAVNSKLKKGVEQGPVTSSTSRTHELLQRSRQHSRTTCQIHHFYFFSSKFGSGFTVFREIARKGFDTRSNICSRRMNDMTRNIWGWRSRLVKNISAGWLHAVAV